MSTRAHAAGCTLATLIGLVACGDPLYDAAFVGEPLAVLDGVVALDGNNRGRGGHGDPRCALFWRTPDGRWLQSPGPGLPAAPGDGWRIPVYAPPPPEVCPDGHAIGRVLAFADLDGDGRRSSGEAFVSQPFEFTVFWSPGGLDATRAPLTHAIGAGFQRVVGPLPCAGPWLMGTQSCDATFGQPCATTSCADGMICEPIWLAESGEVCLTEETACAPTSARLVPNVGEGATAPRWMPACASDAECEGNRICSAAAGVCVDTRHLYRLRLGPATDTPTLCPDPADDARLFDRQ